MLSNETFVRESIDLNLFFLRIMKEHMFFIEAAFTPKNSNLSLESDMLKNEATRILAETISIANGLVSPEVATSGEIVTNYTLQAEQASEYYTGISLDSRLTAAEQGLAGGAGVIINPMIMQQVMFLNQRAITLVRSIIAFKERILTNVLSCRLFTQNYTLLIDHILREARFYLNMLMKLQNMDTMDTQREMLEQEVFWNRIMAEHAKFIRGLLDPTEEDLFDKANMFGKTFDKLTAEAQEAQSQVGLVSTVNEQSLEATKDIRDFKRQGTEGLLGCKVKSIILPLLGDHTLREANHYLRLLKMFNRI